MCFSLCFVSLFGEEQNRVKATNDIQKFAQTNCLSQYLARKLLSRRSFVSDNKRNWQNGTIRNVLQPVFLPREEDVNNKDRPKSIIDALHKSHKAS